ncbi:hypothetical protein ACJX0J_013746, partial [Zea mays]
KCIWTIGLTTTLIGIIHFFTSTHEIKHVALVDILKKYLSKTSLWCGGKGLTLLEPYMMTSIDNVTRYCYVIKKKNYTINDLVNVIKVVLTVNHFLNPAMFIPNAPAGTNAILSRKNSKKPHPQGIELTHIISEANDCIFELT